jgi:hypothetical protein
MSEGREAGERDRPHRRQRSQPVFERCPVGTGGARSKAVDVQCRIDGDLLRVFESERHMEDVIERPEQQGRQDEQRTAGGDLRADEDVAGARTCAARAHDVQRRGQAEGYRRQCRQSDCGREYAGIETRLEKRWCVHGPQQQPPNQDADPHPRGRPERAEHTALGEQLSQDPAAGRTDRDSDGHFPLPGHSP